MEINLCQHCWHKLAGRTIYSLDDEVVEYALSRTMSPMMVAEYKLQLPDKTILQRKLQELINIPFIEE